MSNLSKNHRVNPRVIILYIIFFLSGWSGLIYQIVWSRQFSLVFGVTTYAIGTVLSAFFTGLALGSWLAAQALKQTKINPISLYGLLEIGIGIFAYTIPILINNLKGIYGFVFPLIGDSFSMLSFLRFVIAMIVLIIPTTCMGASLPLISQSLSYQIQNVTINVGNLYAINTLGALCGAAFSGFYAIGTFGLHVTTLIAISANLLAGCGALLIAKALFPNPAPEGPGVSERVVSPSPHERRAQGVEGIPNAIDAEAYAYDLPLKGKKQSIANTGTVILLGLFLSGFVSIGYEVVWTRVLSTFAGRTAFAFTAILCSVLLGIVLGSWLVRIFTSFIHHPIRLLSIFECSVAVITFASILLIVWTNDHPENEQFLVSFALVLIVPNIILGATIPLAVQVYHQHMASVGHRVGEIYAANVLGGVLGSFLTSFIILPLLGSQRTIALLALVNAAVAMLFLWHSEWAYVSVKPQSLAQSHIRPRSLRVVLLSWAIGTVCATLLFMTNPLLIFTGMYKNNLILFHKEDIEGIISITQDQNHFTNLYVNGNLQSNDNPGVVRIHRRLAHLPMLLHPNPQDVLIIGLGAGTTAGAITQHAAQKITVVELVPGMVEGAAWFNHINYGILQDPRVHIIVDDGRNYLLRAKDEQKFDVIESDIIHHRRAGSNYVYSTEYYQLVKSHLKPGGIFCQWLDVTLPKSQYTMLLRTLFQVFPNTTLWEDGMYAVALPEDFTPDIALLKSRFLEPKSAAALKDSDYANLKKLLRSFTMRSQTIERFVQQGEVLTDDYPYIEYFSKDMNKRTFDIPKEDVNLLLNNSFP